MAKGEKRGLRMKELMEATGLPKSMLLHYVSQGLLPEPMRTGRNMAYYDQSSIERAKFIKTIQARYSLPLERIKKLLASKDQGRDAESLAELEAVIFGPDNGMELDRAAFAEATGLTESQIVDLLEAHLLLPLREGVFGQNDVEAGRLFSGAFAQGLQASDLAFYAKIAGDLVDQEMRLRMRLTSDLPEGQDARVTAGLTRATRILRSYIIDRVFQRRVAGAKTLKDEGLLS